MPQSVPIVAPDDQSTIADLLPSFDLALRAAGRSPRTVDLHVGGTKRFVRFLGGEGRSTAVATLSADDYRLFVIARKAAGMAGNTVANDARAYKAFGKWLVAEGIREVDPFERVKVPRVRDVKWMWWGQAVPKHWQQILPLSGDYARIKSSRSGFHPSAPLGVGTRRTRHGGSA